MSTYWGYACKSHDPPLVSEHWLNHGDDFLRTIYEDRAQWLERHDADDNYGGIEVEYRGYGRRGIIEWLAEHRSCKVVLHNEYGTEQTLGPTVSGGVVQAIR